MVEATQRPNYPFHTGQCLEHRLELRSQLADVPILHSVIAFVISLHVDLYCCYFMLTVPFADDCADTGGKSQFEQSPGPVLGCLARKNIPKKILYHKGLK